MVLCLTSGGYKIFVDNGEGAGKKGDWVRQDQERQLVDHQYKNGVTLTQTTFTANRTRFNGRVAMKAGRVILSNKNGSQIQLVVNTVGRFRVEKL